MEKRVIIIHGSYGSADGNWFPWLADSIRKAGHDALLPRFPTPEGQNLRNWLQVFDDEVGKLRGNCILVGHSLGAAFILRLLERTHSRITAAFLVSGFLGALGLPDFDRVNADFVLEPVDWRKVKASSKDFFVYNSDDDPYVPLERGRQIAKELGVDLTIVKGGGHINADSGFYSFPELLEDISRVL